MRAVTVQERDFFGKRTEDQKVASVMLADFVHDIRRRSGRREGERRREEREEREREEREEREKGKNYSIFMEEACMNTM